MQKDGDLLHQVLTAELSLLPNIIEGKDSEVMLNLINEIECLERKVTFHRHPNGRKLTGPEKTARKEDLHNRKLLILEFYRETKKLEGRVPMSAIKNVLEESLKKMLVLGASVEEVKNLAKEGGLVKFTV